MAEKYTYKELQEMWNRTPERQYEVAVAKIIEAINLTDGKICISWSGGADSTFLLYVVCSLWNDLRPNEPLHVVFADTTNECKEIYKFVETFPGYLKDLFGVEIVLHKVRPNNNQTYFTLCKNEGIPLVSKRVADYVNRIRRALTKLNLEYKDIEPYLDSTKENVDALISMGFKKTVVSILTGYNFRDNCFGSMAHLPKKWRPLIYAPFNITAKCCDVLKKQPSSQLRETMENYVAMIGEKASDGEVRKQAYLKTGCNNIIGDSESGNITGVSKPLGAMTEQALLCKAKQLNIPMAELYGEIVFEDGKYKFSGDQRSGCSCCGFGIVYEPDRFVKLYEREPAKVKAAFKSKSEGGLGYKEALEYLNRYCRCHIQIPEIE